MNKRKIMLKKAAKYASIAYRFNTNYFNGFVDALSLLGIHLSYDSFSRSFLLRSGKLLFSSRSSLKSSNRGGSDVLFAH